MSALNRPSLVAAAAVLVSATLVPARAELRCSPRADGLFSTILMTIVDHPDPIDVAAWEVIGPTTPYVLNPGGATRADGRPDIIVDPANGSPIVVWAYNSSVDRDIAISSCSHEGWNPVEFVTATPFDERDPRVAMGADGRLYVAWWTPNDGVFISLHDPADGQWTVPVTIEGPGRDGSRPTILLSGDDVFVGYERTGGVEGEREVVVARQFSDGGPFQRTVVATTDGATRLDPVLHRANGLMWIDWKHGEELFGHAVANGLDWSDWSTAVLSNRTWIDVEQARAIIRNEVLQP